jgi:secreted trypsin-like serine protease
MLGIVENKFNGPFCGATLIHPKWAITAAHCMEDIISANHIQIVSGISDFSVDYQDYMHPIKRIISHPDYDSYNVDNDIALLELNSEVTGIPPLDIYCGDISNTTGIVLGWGRIYSNKEVFSDQLREVSLPVVSEQTCMESTEYLVTENMFCAGYPIGGKDACQGDSGGPFVIYDNNHWQLAGIVSWGDGCAEPGYYGFYTRVSNYFSFISNYVPIKDSFVQVDINHDGKVNLQDVMILFNYLNKDSLGNL